ncbi:hypothetical protein PIB30_062120 [Stylosanthes scabra]|uniref:Uncharacterized protein n=1 Tax=Stylosanthes scabra TaxID=79078 RepID=A0ABU6WJ99_9FABA|nr:hypothetical protein [Stylosanthes scabra]
MTAIKAKRLRPPSRRTSLASCIVVNIFLIFINVILIVYCTINFTYSQYVSVRIFIASLLRKPGGLHVHPAREIDARRTKYMAATFSVQLFPLAMPPVVVTGMPTVMNGGGVKSAVNDGDRVEVGDNGNKTTRREMRERHGSMAKMRERDLTRCHRRRRDKE